MNNRFRLELHVFPLLYSVLLLSPHFPPVIPPGFFPSSRFIWELRLRENGGTGNPAYRGGPVPSSRGSNSLLYFGESIEMTSTIPGGAQLLGTETHRHWRGWADGRPPKAQLPRAPVS